MFFTPTRCFVYSMRFSPHLWLFGSFKVLKSLVLGHSSYPNTEDTNGVTISTISTYSFALICICFLPNLVAQTIPSVKVVLKRVTLNYQYNSLCETFKNGSPSFRHIGSPSKPTKTDHLNDFQGKNTTDSKLLISYFVLD